MRRRTIVQAVPVSEALEEDLADLRVVDALAYRVCDWRDGPAHSQVPCTQVHLVLPVVDGIEVALRLKSARALDELVGVLLEHRRAVFGERGTE